MTEIFGSIEHPCVRKHHFEVKKKILKVDSFLIFVSRNANKGVE